MLPLIVPSDGGDASTAPDHGPEVLRPDESIEPSAAADKNESNWRSTVSTTAELLRTVKETSDAFPPLTSVAGGLCTILENFEVWSTSRSPDLRRLQSSQQTTASKQAIESLASRVKALAESLYAPISEGDFKEESRRKILER